MVTFPRFGCERVGPCCTSDTGLCYAEMANLAPSTGSSYSFVYHTAGSSVQLWDSLTLYTARTKQFACTLSAGQNLLVRLGSKSLARAMDLQIRSTGSLNCKSKAVVICCQADATNTRGSHLTVQVTRPFNELVARESPASRVLARLSDHVFIAGGHALTGSMILLARAGLMLHTGISLRYMRKRRKVRCPRVQV